MNFLIFIFFVSAVSASPTFLFDRDGRVSNGIPARPGEFPFFAYIEYNAELDCGGAFVKYNYVITAAHCAEDFISPQKIFGGVTRINPLIDYKFATTVTYKDYIRHPRWDNHTGENDIALIHMRYVCNDASIFDGFYVKPVALPVASDALNSFVGYSMLAIGFGRHNDTHLSDNLLYGHAPIITNDECLKAFEDFQLNFLVRPTNVCVSTAHGVQACWGDSGGPGVIRRNGEDIVLGLVSWGDVSSCPSSKPMVNTRISSYYNWLNLELTQDRGSNC